MTINFTSGVSTYTLDAGNFYGNSVRIGGDTVYSVRYCGDAALYYRNCQGGFDAFLIEGQCTRTDKYAQSDIYKAYNNNTLEFGRKRFLTEITQTWKLVTGYLTDEESERLTTNLLPSNQVWFHNLKTGEISPCIITNAEAVHKTYSNQGNHLVYYEINIEFSQNEERR